MSDLSALDVSYRPFAPFDEWRAVALNEDLWWEWLDRLRARRERAGEQAFSTLLERSLREAAIDTGAIEGLYATDRGFTVTVAAMSSAWTAQIEREKGRDVRETVEAQRAALDLAIDAATRETPLGEAWIRRVHEVACAPQRTHRVVTPRGLQDRPLPKGRYKGEPNHVVRADGSAHAYAPVSAAPAEMHRLVSELNAPAFTEASPVLQAAYAHHALTAVHPFADGNGRVARVLASVWLLRAASIPLVIYADQQSGYFDALEAADAGRLERFVYFVHDRALDTVVELAETLAPGAPDVATALAAVDRTRRRERGEDDLDLVARRLREVVIERLTAQVSEGERGLAVRAFARFGGLRDHEYRRPVDDQGKVLIAAHLRSPFGVDETTAVELGVARDPSSYFAFRLVTPELDPLDVRLGDVHPRLSAHLRQRLDRWASRVVGLTLDRLNRRLASPAQEER